MWEVGSLLYLVARLALREGFGSQLWREVVLDQAQRVFTRLQLVLPDGQVLRLGKRVRAFDSVNDGCKLLQTRK